MLKNKLSLLLVLAASTVSMHAATITFLENGDHVSVVVEGFTGAVGVASTGCNQPPIESCHALVGVDLNRSSVRFIGSTLLTITQVMEPTGSPEASFVGDYLELSAGIGIGNPDYDISFTSENPFLPRLGCTIKVDANCPIVEDGSIQTAGYAFWSDGQVDTIRFQSDLSGEGSVAAVPEPTSLLLFGSGLATLAAKLRRRTA